jgi:hypothetical protein
MNLSVGARYCGSPNTQFQGRFKTAKVLAKLADPKNLKPTGEDALAVGLGVGVSLVSGSLGAVPIVGSILGSAPVSAGLTTSAAGVIYNRVDNDGKSGDIQ